MLVMTYSNARQNLSSFLTTVRTDGEAVIKRADGSLFRVTCIDNEKTEKSPFENVRPLFADRFSKKEWQNIFDEIRDSSDDRYSFDEISGVADTNGCLSSDLSDFVAVTDSGANLKMAGKDNPEKKFFSVKSFFGVLNNR